MKTGTIIAAAVAVVAIGFGIYMIDFDVSGELRAPDVDVSVTGGEVPDVDADVGEVSVDTKTVEVEVPELNVTPPEDDGVADEDVAQN